MKDFIGALGVLNFSEDTLRVLLFAVALGRLGFGSSTRLKRRALYCPPPPFIT